jgi:dynein intermediate chain
MDEGETKKLVDDVSFQKFIGSSWRILGRALEEDYNILIDYGNEGKEEDSVDNAREIASFFSSQSDGRAITGIDWSHKFPELIASSHTQKHNDPTAQKGLVQIWNLRGSKKSAEYVFNAQSDILSVKFSQYDQRLLYGTAYNGQVFAWDIRSGSYPVLKSPVAGVGHLYPVYSMELTGTQNASTLITASTDGEICTWSTDVLAKPQDKLNLVVTTKHSSGTRRDEESSATALALSHLDASQFHVGTEAGCIYQCSRFAQASLRAGVDNRGLYMGHRAPVTSLSVHPSSGSISLGQYMLSSSTDWSIKLWRIKQFSQLGGSSSKSNTSEFVAPIADISRDDAVYDVAWSPLLPGVFADVDGSGYLDIWNICRDMDFPIFRLKPSNSSTSKPSSGSINRPLNRLSWSRHDPHKVATGGLDGIVSVFQLDPQFLPTQEAEFWVQAKRNLLTLEEQTV